MYKIENADLGVAPDPEKEDEYLCEFIFCIIYIYYMNSLVFSPLQFPYSHLPLSIKISIFSLYK